MFGEQLLCPTMEAVTLSDLGPIIAAVLGPMLLFVAASMRYQHIDSTKTRSLITESEKATLKSIADGNEKNRDLIEKSAEKNRDLIESTNRETRELIEKNRDLIMNNHAAIGDVRERLAHIEGRFAISTEPGTSDDGDAEAA